MKKQIVLVALSLSIGIVACDQKPKETEKTEENADISLSRMNINSLEAEIEKREKVLNSADSEMDAKKASSLMEAYFVYASRFPNRANSADRMFKAAELAMSLNHTIQAIKYFEKVYNDYPEYEKRPYALFLKGFVLENQAQNYEEAKKIYEEFIRLYPGHDMADDAKYSLANMGKTPEELIEEFERQDSIRKAQEAA